MTPEAEKLRVDVLKAMLAEPLASKSADAAIRVVVERCAEIADAFTCGGCGMDGKTGAALRAFLPSTAETKPEESE